MSHTRNVVASLAACCLIASAGAAFAQQESGKAKPLQQQAQDAAKKGMKDTQDAAKKAAKDAQDAAKKAAEAMGMSEEEMQAMMVAGTPAEHHKHLEPLAGEWTATTKFWMAPGAPPTEGTATMKTNWILGGRFLRSEFKSEMMGQPFEGIAYMGFDNIEKHYVSTWIDTMMTGMMMSTGTCDASHKVFTLTGTSKDAMGKTWKMRQVTTVLSNNSHKFEMFQRVDGGEEVKSAEMIYTRVK